MAELMRGGNGAQPAASNGNGSSTTRTRPTAAPAPTSSPSGIRGPRMIMQERAAREAARQRAEQEQMQEERQRAEQEARRLEELQRRGSDRRTATTAGNPAAGQGGGGASELPRESATPQRRPVQAEAPPIHPSASTRRQERQDRQGRQNPPQPQSQPQQRPARAAAPPAQSQTPVNVPQQPPASQQRPNKVAEPPAATAPATQSTPRNSFPHAFERWETLSAHWEGLTNFWIRRLEQNNESIERDPINQSLSRQVTDLSAAGANLFHAVVELQRLRASSERKFQRWFFETRAELERSQEVTAMLETALNEERRARAEAIQEAVGKERANSLNKTRFEELRKELQISKEEARRAWEELGRREQEERERTLSLQSGQPTIVGGVQVVPMTQGVPARGASARQGDYSQPQEYGVQEDGYPAEYSQAPVAQSPIAPAPATTEAGYYTQQRAGQQAQEPIGSEAGYSEGAYQMDPQDDYAHDQRGHKSPFRGPPSPVSDDGADVYETPATNPPSAGYSQAPAPVPAPAPAPPTSSGQQQPPQGYYSQPADYSGSGYGPGWETVPRHHHPTRLSDVIEEDDERSRTSATQSRV